MENVCKYRLYPNAAQRKQIGRTFGCCRFVHNAMLALRSEAWTKYSLSITYGETSSILTAMKKQDHTAWLGDVDATALQSELRRLDAAYQNFFDGRASFPRFKRKHDRHQSYTAQCIYNWKREMGPEGKKVFVLDADGNRIQAGPPTIEVKQGRIKLPRLGWVKCRTPRLPQGKILHATVSRDPDGKYYVSVCFEQPDPVPCGQIQNPVGLDCGLKDLVITSDGVKYANHRYLNQTLRRLRQAQRALSRKGKGSKNREKQRVRVAKLQAKAARQRQDRLHKVSREIVNGQDAVFTEDLNIAGMMKNHHLACPVADASWGELQRQLKYKCERKGKTFASVDRFYPSSQLCSRCGAKNPAVKDLSVREWDCPVCGAHHDRDVNAAINICAEGMRITSTA